MSHMSTKLISLHILFLRTDLMREQKLSLAMKINPVVLNSEIPAEVLNQKNLLVEIKIFEAEEIAKKIIVLKIQSKSIYLPLN